MKFALTAFVVAAAMLGSAPVMAGPDDAKWIAQCVKDNKDEGAKEGVIKSYCSCMNDKMDDNETQSITQWEKKNPKAMQECSKKAGWK